MLRLGFGRLNAETSQRRVGHAESSQVKLVTPNSRVLMASSVGGE